MEGIRYDSLRQIGVLRLLGFEGEGNNRCSVRQWGDGLERCDGLGMGKRKEIISATLYLQASELVG